MKYIKKYPLEIKEIQKVSLPKRATVLSISLDEAQICLHVMADNEEEDLEERKIRIHQSEEEMDTSINRYIYLGHKVLNQKDYYLFISEKAEGRNEQEEVSFTRMWETKRPSYYQNEQKGNKQTDKDNIRTYYHSVDEYIKAWGKDIDYDLIVIFRWDWTKHTEQHGNPMYVKKFGNNCETLEIYCYQQKTEKLFLDVVSVTREDEEKLKQFLIPFWENLQKLWYPIN